MSFPNPTIGPSALLRPAGTVLMISGGLALRHMALLVGRSPIHDASSVEVAFAAIGFLGMSGGATLAVLGAHIFDEIPLSHRWAAGLPKRRHQATAVTPPPS